MELKFNLKSAGVIPGTDPQDGGYDTFLNFVCTRDPTSNEPLMPYNFPWLPFWWQTATSSDSWTTYTTTNFWLCVNSTAENMVWWRMVFDANIHSVLYKAQGSAILSLGSATISCPSLNSGDQIQLNYQTPGGTPGAIFVESVTAGTGFTVRSSSLLDGSTFNWSVLN
jgi:hypothetical protein